MGFVNEKGVDASRLKVLESDYCGRQSMWYNRRHVVRDWSPFQVNQPVVVRDPNRPTVRATVIGARGGKVLAARDNGVVLRRNRAHISRSTDVRGSFTDSPQRGLGASVPHSPIRQTDVPVRPTEVATFFREDNSPRQIPITPPESVLCKNQGERL